MITCPCCKEYILFSGKRLGTVLLIFDLRGMIVSVTQENVVNDATAQQVAAEDAASV